ncbi:NAD(P)/FAD-dependent oxidoreductase [Bacillus ectoiniformans]|uniref:NAD(P)/FAD-dependent oxidoreductase n=1 Tax=Bacillus ectoiniformans TaxID=1494429 RepID=UPI00195BE150|nr:NAD(P)/FAD-dependent oxidoreductase [Bacillus ectoiniformans]
MDQVVDVVIVGGGPGGSSAALVLGRSRRNVVMIDDENPRNKLTKKSHGFLTMDGKKPEEFRKAAREELTQYKNIQIYNDLVIHSKKDEGLFVTTTKQGLVVTSRKLIFATGMIDSLPDIPGLHEAYGASVFHCPYCDGWERQNQPLAILGNGENLFDYVQEIYHWSKALVVLTNGPSLLSSEEHIELLERGIEVVETEIARLECTDGLLKKIWLKNGESIERKGLFIMDTGAHQSSRIPEKLGVALKDTGAYETSGHGETAIEGLSIIGDAKNKFTGLVGAASQGYEIAVVINNELIKEDWASEKKRE